MRTFTRSLNEQQRALWRVLLPRALFVVAFLTVACGDDSGDLDVEADAGLDAAVAAQSSTHSANPTHSASPSTAPSTVGDSGTSSSAALTTEIDSSTAPSAEPTPDVDGSVSLPDADSGAAPSAEPTPDVDGSVSLPDADSGAAPSVEPTFDVDGSVAWPDSSAPDASASAAPSEVPTEVPSDDGGVPNPGTWPVDASDGGVFEDGLLTNGSFDAGTDGWMEVVNPNGYDSMSHFSWIDGSRVASGIPAAANAQAFYQDFTVPTGPITAATFSFHVAVNAFGYLTPETAQPLEADPYGSAPNAFRVDIIASSDAGGSDAGSGMLDVFTAPVLFELYAPLTSTYGVEHVVFDSAGFASFLDSRRGETLRLRVGVVSSSSAVWGEFDNVSLMVEM